MKTISYQEAKKLANYFEEFKVYKPITIVKKLAGYSLIGIGVITLPLPTGSIFLIMLGCALLAIDYKKLLKTINFYGKETAYWALRLRRILR